jgi:hypothetical protein
MTLPQSLRDIHDERLRQLIAKKYTYKHDDGHTNGELSKANELRAARANKKQMAAA